MTHRKLTCRFSYYRITGKCADGSKRSTDFLDPVKHDRKFMAKLFNSLVQSDGFEWLVMKKVEKAVIDGIHIPDRDKETAVKIWHKPKKTSWC